MLFFLACSLVVASYLVVPGFVLMRALGLGHGSSLAFAPAGSVAIISLLAIAYGYAGIGCSPVTLVLMPSAAMSAFAIMRLRHERRAAARGIHAAGPSSEDEGSGPDLVLILLYVVLGVGAAMLVLVRHLPSFDSINEAWDIVHHLNEIRAFVESGRFSSFSTSVYLADPATNPVTSAVGFYPSAWNSLCALVVQTTGCEVAYSINVVNFVTCGLVFPLSMCGFLADVFAERPAIARAGALATISFAAFPWGLLVFGPLYPNLLGFSLLPFLLWVVRRVVERVVSRSLSPMDGALVFVMLAAGAFSHPNVVFSAGVFAIVYVTWAMPRLVRGGSRTASARMVLVARLVFLVAVAVIWNALYAIPFMAELLKYDWHAYATPAQAVVNILSLGYVYGFQEGTAQLVLAVLVVAGMLLLLRRREESWLVAAYLFACVILFVDITSDDALKPILTGFWYKEAYRISAMVVVFAVPLAAVGIEWGIRSALGLLRIGEDGGRTAATLVTSLAYLVVVFFPSFILPGRQVPTTTGFSTMFSAIQAVNNDANGFYDNEERAFVRDAAQVTGQDLVENNPFDGSLVAYGDTGMRVVNRNLQGYGSSKETDDAKLLRTSLAEIADREDVRAAAQRMGVRYVMVFKRTVADDRFFGGFYDRSLWEGISSIEDDTPGFTVVLSRGGMRLYRIDSVG